MEEGLDGQVDGLDKIWPCLRISSCQTSSSQVPCGCNCHFLPPHRPPLQLSQRKNCNSHSVPRQNSYLQHVQNLKQTLTPTKHNFFFFFLPSPHIVFTNFFHLFLVPMFTHTHAHTHTHTTHTVPAGTQTGAADLSPQDEAQSTASMSV